MQHVNFLPWVGKNYHLGIGPQQLKLLVLGESHYCYELGNGQCPGCSVQNCIKLGFTREDFHNQTIGYIDELVNSYTGAQYQQTGVCFERAVMGKALSEAERSDFWNSLIFYNYVQKALPKKERERTPITKNDLNGSEEAFREVLTHYQPDRIVVWGSRVFNLLPEWNGQYSTLAIEENQTDIWTYNIENKLIPCMKVHHPSTPIGKAWTHWHKFYRAFLM